jgi:hypothetical protein
MNQGKPVISRIPNPSRRLGKGTLLAAHGTAVFALCVLTLLVNAEVPSGPVSLWWRCLLVTCFVIWAVASWYWARGGLFNPYGLFLLATLAFNVGQVPLQVFGLNQNGLLAQQFSNAQLEDALLFLGGSLIFLHTGALLALPNEQVWRTRRALTPPKRRAALHVGLVLVAVATIPSIIVATKSVDLVTGGGYLAIYDQNVARGVAAAPQILAALLLPGALLVLVGSEGRRRWVLLSGIAVGASALVHLYIGDRGGGALPVIAWLWAYSSSVRKVDGRLLLITCLTALIVVFPVVRQLRTLDAAARGSVGVVGAFTSVQNPVLFTISETGNSLSTVAATMELVPRTRGFDNGAGYGYAALTAVPNLFWAVHPSVAHGDYSTWLINEISPDTLYVYHISLGFSYMAEAFINFGWFGLLVCLLIGMGVVRLEVWAQSGDITRNVVVGTSLAALLWWPRAEAYYEVRDFLWYGLLPFLVVGILARSASHRPRFGFIPHRRPLAVDAEITSATR